MANPKAAAVAFGTILGIDGFFHVFWPAIGVDFLVWNKSVFESFISWAPGVTPTIPGAFLTLLYAFAWGALMGYIFALIYNAVDKKKKKRSKR